MLSFKLNITANYEIPSQPTQNDVPQEVIDLGPDELVVLVYNCYYMRDICKNAYNFLNTERGKALHPQSELSNDVFGYDLNTKKGMRPPSRRVQRGQHSCPSNWKNSHTCPEFDQRDVMRHDGQWFSNALEPNTNRNAIINYRNPITGQVIYSKIRYTCDEFPPATWVEGGDGENSDQPAQTRCAAMRCGAGAKAEQDCKPHLAKGIC